MKVRNFRTIVGHFLAASTADLCPGGPFFQRYVLPLFSFRFLSFFVRFFIFISFCAIFEWSERVHLTRFNFPVIFPVTFPTTFCEFSTSFPAISDYVLHEFKLVPREFALILAVCRFLDRES